ncbi:putative lipopolysaccharide heptosyltransferase I [Chlamydiales bacterium STE3]|nr:putative lipopolysaccharide heptosyltransferase I [Chlamydiales bacterium STE3]
MKILIIKTSSLGDIVHAFTALASLRKTYPEAQIDWVVEQPFAELLSTHPYVDHVIPIHTKLWRKKFFSISTYSEIKNLLQHVRQPYDLLFDLQGNSKSGFVTGLVNAKTKVGFGLKTVWEYPNLFFTNVKFNPPKTGNVREESLYLVEQYCKSAHQVDDRVLLKLSLNEREWLDQFLQTLPKGTQRVFVAAGSNWKNKQLNPQTLANFLELIQLEKNSFFLLGHGNEEEKKLSWEISRRLPNCILLEKLSLPLLQNLMAEMNLVIAMDSLPLHLAATAGVSTFGVFGPSSAEKFAPFGNQHTTVQGPCPYGKNFSRRCPILRSCPTGACIKNLTAETLFAAYQKQFS